MWKIDGGILVTRLRQVFAKEAVRTENWSKFARFHLLFK